MLNKSSAGAANKLNCASNQDQGAKRIFSKRQQTDQDKRANFLSLACLEGSLPKDLFAQVVHHVQNSSMLPQRQAWDGSLQDCSFDEFKLNSGQNASSSLLHLLEGQPNLATKIHQFFRRKNSSLSGMNPIHPILKNSLLGQICSRASCMGQICNFKNNWAFSNQIIGQHNQNRRTKQNQVKYKILNSGGEQFKRMKTVFGHANFADGTATPVYNCKFDLLNRVVITGADDGIIKVWNKENMILQASLHGHTDVVVDIQISKCNRYMASASQDGCIIIWNLEDLSIISKRTSDHSAQVNKLEFIMIECSPAQTEKNIYGNLQKTVEKANNISQMPVFSEDNNLRSYVAMYQAPQYLDDSDQLGIFRKHDKSDKSSKNRSKSAGQFNSKSGMQSATIANLKYHEHQPGNQFAQNGCPLPKCYDQFLVSCSDDGSINIYDLSSLYKHTYDEYYTKGPDDSSLIYQVHQRNQKAQKTAAQTKTEKDICQMFQRIQRTLQNEDIQPAQAAGPFIIIKENSSNQQPESGNQILNSQDKITRRTRKRQLLQNQPQTSVSNYQQSNDDDEQKDSRKKQKGEISMITLRSPDFRTGTRNIKHIDSIAIDPIHKFLLAGTSHGEIYIWYMNFQMIRSKSTNLNEKYCWLGSFKVHKKSIHQLKLSKDSNLLFVGSDDGTATLWKMHPFTMKLKSIIANNDSINQANFEDIDFFDNFLVHKFDHTFEYNLRKNNKNDPMTEFCDNLIGQIDSIEWSRNSRYAYCAISIKEQKEQQEDGSQNSHNKEKQQDQANVKIQVYDTHSMQLLSNDLAQDCKYYKNVLNYACVMRSHPQNESVLLSCFDGGLVLIFDTQRMSIVQEIIEYGIYSIDQFTMNNQVDVDFSTDGDYIAFSSYFGTLSLYTNQHHKIQSYLTTRVQQFFMYDNTMHSENLYEQQLVQPQLCGYELNPFEVQPEPPIIGKFKNGAQYDSRGRIKSIRNQSFLTKSERAQQADEFKRKETFALEFAQEEEKFIRDQLTDGLRLGYFNLNSQNELDEIMMAGEAGRAQGASPPRTQRLISQFMHIQSANSPENFISGYEDRIGSDNEALEGNFGRNRRRLERVHRSRHNNINYQEQPVNAFDDGLQRATSSQLFDDYDYRDDDLDSNEQSNSQEQQHFSSDDHDNDDRISYRENQEEQQRNDVSRRRRLHRPSNREDANRESSRLGNAFDRLQNSVEGIFAPNDDNAANNEGVARFGRRNRQRRRHIEPSGETSQMLEAHENQSEFLSQRNIGDIYASRPQGGAERRLRQPIADPELGGRGTRMRRQVRRFNQDDDSQADVISLDQTSRNDRRQQTGSFGRDRNARRQGLRQQVNGHQDIYDEGANNQLNERNQERRGANLRNGDGFHSSRRLRRQNEHYQLDQDYMRRDEQSVNQEDDYDDEDQMELLDDESEPMRANRKLKKLQDKNLSNPQKKGRRRDVDLDQSQQQELQERDDKIIEKKITSCSFFEEREYQRDDEFSQRYSGNKRSKCQGNKIHKSGKFTSKPDRSLDKCDYAFVLSEEQKLKNLEMEQTGNYEPFCSFCQRQMDRQSLVGPFILENPSKIIDKTSDLAQAFQEALDPRNEVFGIYFHQQCLEYNQYVLYDKKQDRWINIRTALKYLIEQKQYTCYRCLQPGASLQCNYCDRSFHGHYCSIPKYVLAEDFENSTFICIFCKNDRNFQEFNNNPAYKQGLLELRGDKIDKQRKKIGKSYLVETEAYGNNELNYFQPQIDDQVIYFYQGHERFYQGNNCFFYCGDQQKKSSTDLPWMRLDYLKNLPVGQVLCQVKNIQNKFCSLQATSLMNQFGDCSSDIQQNIKIITYIELEIIEQQVLDKVAHPHKKTTFIVEIFPCEVPQFLVPVQIFEQKKAQYQQLIQDNKIVGYRFKTHRGSSLFQGREVKVQEISPLEPSILDESNWESIVVSEVKPITDSRFDRRRNNQLKQSDSQRIECIRINFWDLIMNVPLQNSQSPSKTPQNQTMKAIAKEYLPVAFDEMETNRLIDAIRLFVQKNTEMESFFKERVSEKIADDYRSYVATEMWLDLIIERLKKQYYRSQNQLWCDIESIANASTIYNGEDDELTDQAKSLTTKLKKELRQYVNTNKLPSRKNKMNINSKSDKDGLGFQISAKPTPQNQTTSSQVIIMSQGSKNNICKEDYLMEDMDEQIQLQKAMQASIEQLDHRKNNSGDKVSLINGNCEQNQKYSSKSRHRAGLNRSKAREIIDDEEDNNIQLNVDRAAKDEAAYGSDQQNCNQNNIDFNQGIDVQFSQKAYINADGKDKGKKSVEVTDVNHFGELNGQQLNKKRRGRPKKNGVLQNSQLIAQSFERNVNNKKKLEQFDDNINVQLQMDEHVNILISKDVFHKSVSKDSVSKLEINLENYDCEHQDKHELNLVQGFGNVDQNTLIAGKSSKSKQLSNGDQLNQITSTGHIGVKRYRNEISESNDDGYQVNDLGLSQNNNVQTDSKDSQGNQQSSSNLRQSTRNKRQRLILDKEF